MITSLVSPTGFLVGCGFKVWSAKPVLLLLMKDDLQTEGQLYQPNPSPRTLAQLIAVKHSSLADHEQARLAAAALPYIWGQDHSGRIHSCSHHKQNQCVQVALQAWFGHAFLLYPIAPEIHMSLQPDDSSLNSFLLSTLELVINKLIELSRQVSQLSQQQPRNLINASMPKPVHKVNTSPLGLGKA